jgi:excisionase family DNA binding protein
VAQELYNVKQLEKALGLSERTIFRLLDSGELTGFKAGREWRFTQADIDAYIDLQRRKAEEKRQGKGKKPQSSDDNLSEVQALVEGEAFAERRPQPPPPILANFLTSVESLRQTASVC